MNPSEEVPPPALGWQPGSPPPPGAPGGTSPSEPPTWWWKTDEPPRSARRTVLALAPFGAGDGADPIRAPKTFRTRQAVAVAVCSMMLVGLGAGLALLLSPPGGGVGSSAAGLFAASGAGSMTTQQVVRAVDPAVVDINTTVSTSSGRAEAAGTGMILTTTGEIVTNNHVVQNATRIEVTVAAAGGGHATRYVANFVGADPRADIAVIKLVGASGLSTVRLGRSSNLAVGDPVIAVGNALGLGGTPSVTAGTISALGRSINASDDGGTYAEHLKGMIQTDAPIAPGNSGGPLVDRTGRVIGMNTAAASAAGGTATALAFALPIDRVKAIVGKISSGRPSPDVVLGRSTYLGIDGTTITLLGGAAKSGVNVVEVGPGTPAARAGIRAGDVIVAFDGHPTPSIEALSAMIRVKAAGSAATVTFQSQGDIHTATVHLVPGPAA